MLRQLPYWHFYGFPRKYILARHTCVEVNQQTKHFLTNHNIHI